MPAELGSYFTDTTPDVEMQLTADEAAQDLTGATIEAVLVDEEGVERTYAASIVGDATDGLAKFEREQSPPIPAGDHGVRMVVTFTDGTTRSYPGTKTLPTLSIFAKGNPA